MDESEQGLDEAVRVLRRHLITESALTDRARHRFESAVTAALETDAAASWSPRWIVACIAFSLAGSSTPDLGSAPMIATAVVAVGCAWLTGRP